MEQVIRKFYADDTTVFLSLHFLPLNIDEAEVFNKKVGYLPRLSILATLTP